MSKHLFGIVLTPNGVAANNRGETEGNITTLQKIMWNGEQHTTVSAEAIRWAIRWIWQHGGVENLNRTWLEKGEKPQNNWEDRDFKAWLDDGKAGERYIDDDVLGFMSAEAAKEETNDSENDSVGKKKTKKKGTTVIRRARLEVTRAVSLTPFEGDITFNAASIGATPSASRTGSDPVPYGTEMHATRYQYGFALTPKLLEKPERAMHVLDAIVSLGEVGGNHARFLFDFSPESVAFRYTDDFAPRMLYGFGIDKNGVPTVDSLVEKVKTGDIKSNELVLGGKISNTEAAQSLKDQGVTVCGGVKEAADIIKNMMNA